MSSAVHPYLRRRRGGGCDWSAADDDLLRQWVSVQGVSWAALLRLGAFPGRSAHALRNRWASLLRSGRALPGQPLPACLLLLTATVLTAPPPPPAARPSPTPATAPPASFAPFTFAESATTATGNARRLAHGRSWTQAIARRPPPGARDPAPRERELAAHWGLRPTGPLLAASVPLGLQREGRGSPLPCIPASAPLCTLMASRARVPLVRGTAAPELRLLTALEAARLMGIDLRSRVWRVAAAALPEDLLWAAVADGVDAHMVRALWANGAELAALVGRPLPLAQPLNYVGLFCGALDTILHGGQASGWWARCVALSERDPARRECAGSAYLVPKSDRYASTWELASAFAHALPVPRIDVLSATPSCRLLSPAQRALGPLALTALRASARAQLLDDISAIRAAAEACIPSIIYLEETSGLATHHKALLEEVQSELRSWPYVWRFDCVDCVSLGAAHHRSRVLWVGVRRSGA